MSIRLTIIAGCAMAFCALTVGGAREAAAVSTRLAGGEASKASTTSAHEEPSTVLRQQTATAMLRAAGIRWVSTGGCTDRWNPHCTSLEGVRLGTVGGLLALRDASGCPLVISGGTEVGHMPGPFSHQAGYKLDVVPNRCLNAFVRRNFTRIGTRGDGAAQYRGPGQTTFAREPSHWDVTFG